MNTNGIILRDMNTDGRTTDFRPKTTDVRPKTIDVRLKTACLRGAGGILARSILTLLLLLAGALCPVGRFVCKEW